MKNWLLIGLYVLLFSLFMTSFVMFHLSETNQLKQGRLARLVFNKEDFLLSDDEVARFKPRLNDSRTHKKASATAKYVPSERLQEHTELALANFTLSKVQYSFEHLQKKPLISIVTRTYNRPLYLKRNRTFIHSMSSKNFEHVILQDRVGAGMEIAETALYAFREQYEGDYICHVDDDDYIANTYFIRDMEDLINVFNKPKIIIYRVWLEEEKKEMPSSWKSFPTEGSICTNNVLYRKDIYLKNCAVVGQAHAGDYLLVHNALLDCSPKEIVWVDRCYMSVSSKSHEYSETEYVTVVPQGGLGNQLFQMAVAYAYAIKNGKQLVVDKSQKVISPHDAVQRPNYWKTLFSWIAHRELKHCHWNEYVEQGFAHQDIPIYYGHVQLRGYFQSSKYFHTIRDEWRQIINEHLRKATFVKSLPRTSGKMNVAIHIRRTDYINNSFHTNQSIDKYYQPAYQLLKQSLNIGDDQLVLNVFSDDLAWCEAHLPSYFGCSLYFVKSSTPKKKHSELDDLFLMTCCEHFIIANSSFSWWGAYLCPFPGKHVIAPRVWFNDGNLNWQDIYEQDWKQCG